MCEALQGNWGNLVVGAVPICFWGLNVEWGDLCRRVLKRGLVGRLLHCVANGWAFLTFMSAGIRRVIMVRVIRTGPIFEVDYFSGFRLKEVGVCVDAVADTVVGRCAVTFNCFDVNKGGRFLASGER